MNRELYELKLRFRPDYSAPPRCKPL